VVEVGASERSVVVDAKERRCCKEDFVVDDGVTNDAGARLPPREIPHELDNEGDEKLAAEGLDAKAKRAVAATRRKRFLGWLANLVIVDNINFCFSRVCCEKGTMSS